MRNILVVEDDADVGDLMTLHLRDAGYQVRLAMDGREGLELARRSHPSLLVLDLSLPGVDGLELCRRLRAEDDPTPILMVTARSSEIDRVVGLEVGGDDYLSKPFGVPELLARVKALLRRAERGFGPAAPDRIEIGELHIDRVQRTVHRGGRPLELTAKEFDLLYHLARNPGRAHRRSELLRQVWGYEHPGYEHTVSTHINRLRAKLEPEPSRPRWIQTVWGVGYRLQEAEGGDR